MSFRIGPLAAMEIDEAVKALEAAGIPFEIEKDSNIESKKMKDDITSIVRTEFRTDVFLDQSFFITVPTAAEQKTKELLGHFVGVESSVRSHPAPSVESGQERMDERVYQSNLVRNQLKRARFNQRLVFALILFFLGVVFFESFVL